MITSQNPRSALESGGVDLASNKADPSLVNAPSRNFGAKFGEAEPCRAKVASAAKRLLHAPSAGSHKHLYWIQGQLDGRGRAERAFGLMLDEMARAAMCVALAACPESGSSHYREPRTVALANPMTPPEPRLAQRYENRQKVQTSCRNKPSRSWFTGLDKILLTRYHYRLNLYRRRDEEGHL